MRRLLALACAVVFFESAFYAVITPLLPELSSAYGLSKAQAGVLTASYGAGTLVGSLPFGWMTAHAGARRTLQLGLAVMVVGSVTFPLAGTAGLLDLARFTQGAGAAGVWTAALGWVVGGASAERRGAAIGTTMAAATVGTLFGPVLGGVASAVSTEVVFAVAAVFGVVCMVAAERVEPPQRLGAASIPALLASLRDRRVAVGLWLMVLAGTLFGTIYVLTPLRLHALGAGAAAVSAAFLVASAIETGISPLAGRLLDVRGWRLPASCGLAGGVVVMVLLPLPDKAWLLVLTIMLTAPLIGFLWTPAIGLVGEGAESLGVEPGFAFALTNIAWALGQSGGSSGSAALAEAAGDAAAYGVLAVACLATLAGLQRVGARR